MVVLFFVFFWIYKNMKENRFKEWVRESMEKIKSQLRGE